MQLNLNVHFWVGFIVTLASAIAGGTVHLTNAIPSDWIPVVTAWSSIIAVIGGGYLTVLSQAGAAVSPPATPPKAAIVALAIGLSVLAMGWSAPADAQQAPRAAVAAPRLTGNPIKDFGSNQATVNEDATDLVGKLGKLSLPDFQYALAMATATNNVVSKPCWQAWVDLLTAQQKALIGPDGQTLIEPDPHLITNVERLSELLANLRPDSPISTSCAALAGAAGKDASALIGGILSGGALGLFKLPIPIP
jgi:hypothetical protein